MLQYFKDGGKILLLEILKGGGKMPNIKSAKKRVIVSENNAMRNKAARSELKTAIKKADAAIANNASDKDAAVKLAVKKIDAATTKGILHKNNAARKKSALVKRANNA